MLRQLLGLDQPEETKKLIEDLCDLAGDILVYVGEHGEKGPKEEPSLTRLVAESIKKLHEEFIHVGFTREQAMTLTLAFIQRGQEFANRRPR